MKTCSRRQLLGAVGATVLSLPFLHAARSRADGAVPHRRLLIFATPNGTLMNHFFPSSTGSLDSWTPPDDAILAPLAPFRDRLCILRGINNEAAVQSELPNHDPDNASILTGYSPIDDNGTAPGGISIDQRIAAALGVSVRTLGVKSDGIVSATGAGGGVTPISDPGDTFVSLFSGASVPQDEGSKRARRRILELGMAEAASLRCKLGGADRHKLEAHLHALQKIEDNLDAECVPPAPPGSDGDYRALGEKQMDMLVEALACGLVDVATLQWSYGGAYGEEFPGGKNGKIGHHEGAHNHAEFEGGEPEQKEFLRSVNRWYAERFAYLLAKLEDRQDPDGSTLLDNLAVVWVNEQSNGGSHLRRDMPYVIAGSCGGRLRNGVALDLGGRSADSGDSDEGSGAVGGPPHASNKLMMTLAHAMGAPIDEFGDMSLATPGPFEELLV